MNTSLLVICTAGIVYLAALVFVAVIGERDERLRKLARHPLTYALGLGVFASSWTYYGCIGFCAKRGLEFLAVYIGPTLSCLLVPVLWAPLARLTDEHRLGSLADLFAFRFRSQAVGIVVTIGLVVSSVPYLGQQVRAVTESVDLMAGTRSAPLFGFIFSLAVAFFATLVGGRRTTSNQAQDGLLLAIAMESLVKLLALGAVAVLAIRVGLSHPQTPEWTATRAVDLGKLTAPLRAGAGWPSLLFLSFSAAFLLPRQFHIAFSLGGRGRHLRTASWAFPTYLLLITLPVVPVLFAGSLLHVDAPPDFYVLALPMASGDSTLSFVAFIGGFSAASAMVIVTTLALTTMVLNHLVLPLSRRMLLDPHARLAWFRRGVIVVLVLAGYGFFLAAHDDLLVVSGISSFIAIAQFLPGVLALLFWKEATRAGFLAGLLTGLGGWLVTSVAPIVGHGPFELERVFAPQADDWTLPTFVSLSANVIVFVAVSLLFAPQPEEREAAEQCAADLYLPRYERLHVASVQEFHQRLAPLLGAKAARIEVDRAVSDLGMAPEDVHRGQFLKLRDATEKNLSSLFGPVLARTIVHEHLRGSASDALVTDQVRFLEERLEGVRLQGVAAQLDLVRRYLRSLLEEIPLGVCALGPDGSVVVWNRAIERLTGIPSAGARGKSADALAPPWAALLVLDETPLSGELRHVDVLGKARAFRIHRTAIDRSFLGDRVAKPAHPRASEASAEVPEVSAGVLYLLEDHTEILALEAQLVHRDRLASIGRLAAGVAHEIGNPVTAIACLAQNLVAELPRDAGAEHSQRASAILTQTARIEAIVHSLLSYSRDGGESAALTKGRVRVTKVPVAKLVDEAIALVRLDPITSRIAFENLCDESVRVVADSQQLLQVLVNILTNASDACSRGGQVIADVSTEGAHAELRITDTGEGMVQELLDRAFEPFVTTKSDRGGTGLGLALVRSIVGDHGGDVVLESVPGAGTTVRVRLPAGERP